jgi:biopolymer transport protein ExbB
LTGLDLQPGSLWQEALQTWNTGGWAMIAIALTALAMFGLGLRVWLEVAAFGHRGVKLSELPRWLDQAHLREGRVGDLVSDFAGCDSLDAVEHRLASVQASQIRPLERELKLMKVCVSAAPLLGLLGTVTGMLTTFAALSEGSGGDQTMSAIAGGISEALVTTMTGLVIALPGLFFQYVLGRKFAEYRYFLDRLETMCRQRLLRRSMVA